MQRTRTNSGGYGSNLETLDSVERYSMKGTHASWLTFVPVLSSLFLLDIFTLSSYFLVKCFPIHFSTGKIVKRYSNMLVKHTSNKANVIISLRVPLLFYMRSLQKQCIQAAEFYLNLCLCKEVWLTIDVPFFETHSFMPGSHTTVL